MRHLIFCSFLAALLCNATIASAQNAIHFDGVNDYVQTTYSGVTGSSDRTFEAWVKVDAGAPASNLCILDYGANVVGSRNTFNVNGSLGLSFISGGTNANIGSTASVITKGQWTHVAFVLDNGTGYLYVNGTQVGTGSLTSVNTPTGNQDLRFGQRVSGGSIPFEGAIDEVRIWNVARSQTEIANNRNTEFCTVPTGLVAYYNFNQAKASGNNSGQTTLHNAVLNDNGTLTNFSLSGSSSNWVTGASITAGLSVSKNTRKTCDSLASPSGLYYWKSTGIYYDTLTNANNCDSILRFDLTVNNSAYDVVNDTSCKPYVSPSGNYTYINTGQYFDTTLTIKGCPLVHELNLEINIIDSNVVYAANTLTSSQANATYQWLDCNDNFAPISGATAQSFNLTSNGNYAVRVEMKGCVDTSACTDVTWLGIEEASAGSVHIYPNPSSGTLYVEGIEEGKLSIIDSKGSVAFETILERNANKSISLPLSLRNGMYQVFIQNEGMLIRKKLLVNRDQ